MSDFSECVIVIGKQCLVENAIAGRQCSGDLLQSTPRGGRGVAASRRHKTGCIIDASLPRVLLVSHSRHGLSKSAEILSPGKSNTAHPLVVWEALSVDLTDRQFPSMAHLLLLVVATYCRLKEMLALRRQNSVPPTLKHWSLLISTSGTDARP